MANEHYLIGRQPILNRLEETVSYELLFRSSASLSSARIHNAAQATSRVILNTVSGFSMQDILGQHTGFINVDVEMLMSDAIELLPPDSIGLELLESLVVTPEIIQRCADLKKRGFQLALDDHEYSPACEGLYHGIVDIIKIDLLTTPLEAVYQMMEQFSHYPVRLLAEKVDTRHCYLRSRTMGFELFQGYFFSRPSVMQKRRMEDSSATFFKLMQQLAADAAIEAIEQTFKQSPALTYKLLLLVNSVAIGRREKIRSVRHAITMIGMVQLKRWVQLAIFADDGRQGMDNPLLDMVAVRAAFMEEMAHRHPHRQDGSHRADEAFMTGTLSVLQDIYEIPMETLVSGLNLSEEIQQALTTRTGYIGELLCLAELIERMELDAAVELLERLDIPLLSAFECQKKAFMWRESMA